MKMPVCFIGHGSPMNLVYENEYTLGWKELAENLPQPKAILCISAHWNTEVTQFTSSEEPTQIFDFFGFPNPLYEIEYKAKGSKELCQKLEGLSIASDASKPWGLDHGSWALLHHMYPKKDIPVVQLSLCSKWDAKQHLEFSKQLQFLREEGVLILGSGNIVHNLQKILWSSQAPGHQWAKDFEAFVLATLLSPSSLEKKLETLFSSSELSLAHPSLEHFYPLVYCLGASTENDQIRILQKGIQNGSISMASILFSEK